VSKTLSYFVYASNGTLVARTLYIDIAAAICSMEGDGTTIRTHGESKRGTPIVRWTEGVDGRAADSYDATAEHIFYHESPYGARKVVTESAGIVRRKE
jgi:hypothetical protein